MAAVDDPKTLGRTRLSFASEADIDEFVATLEKFENGELTPDQWRMFRLVRGTYGQRQPGDVQMLRIKIPQGVLTAPQLEALADVGERFSRGFGHITTRQNIQFHFVKLHDVEAAMRILADAGLTTREACGNSVRNITCCPKAGVSPTELFDVTPYSEAMTRYLLRHPLSSSLPRKFKIAFEGCTDEDHALLGMHDLGYRAAIKDGRRGFRVVVGGGTSIMVKSAEPVHDFLPASEIFNVAEAVIRVFHEFGDYKHKQANRLKFLIKKLGWDGFLAEYRKKLAEFRAQGGAALPFDPENPPVEAAPAWRRIDSPPILANRVARDELAGDGSRHRAAGAADAADDERRLLALAQHQRAQAEAERVFLRHRDDSARRLHEPADAHPRRSRDGVRRRHDSHHRGAESRVPLGARPTPCPSCTGSSRRPDWD